MRIIYHMLEDSWVTEQKLLTTDFGDFCYIKEGMEMLITNIDP